jgi:dUTP pyrophosphatase
MEDLVIGIKASHEMLVPFYASKGAAGADLKAFIETPRVLEPGKSMLIPTGIFLDIPEGYEVQIRPRSGLALKNGITVLNTPGTIDSDYKGEIGVILINHSQNPFTVEPFMRIAQMVVAKYEKVVFENVQELTLSERGAQGFGSSGLVTK